MVETGLKEWLEREDAPGDFYLLIGQPRLCRDRDQLFAGLEIASEYLFQFQNHRDKTVRDRARTFQRQVADARRTISDDSRWDAYNQNLINRLYGLFRENPEFTKPNPKLDNLRRWLALVQHVDRTRIEELIAVWTADLGAEVPAAWVKGEVRPSIQPIARRVTGTFGSDDKRSGSKPVNNRVMASAGSVLPPPPPSRLGKSGRHTQGPPASSSKPTGSSAMPAPAAAPHQAKPAGLRPFPQDRIGNTTALWIVLAAVLTSFVLGVFALFIAWASGAFERNRAGFKSPMVPTYVQRLQIEVSNRRGESQQAVPNIDSIEDDLA